jgi:RNA polymerase sigma-70 factor, ECF subfamily
MNAIDDETQLTIAACHGSLVAFEDLMRLCEPHIRRFLYGKTHDVQLTQDLCQETFLAAFRVITRMDGEKLRFASWVYKIALNQFHNELRRRKYVTVLPFSASTGVGASSSFEEYTEASLLTEDSFEYRVLERDLVQRALAELPEASSTCLLLDAEGFSYKEIAEITQDSLSAVRSRLSRARQAFQRVYAQIDQEGNL